METLQKSRFPWREFLKSIAAITIPVALQNLLTTTGSMLDTMMIAALGENYVGAVGLCAQFTSLMFSCYWGFIGGGMLFYAQYYGAKDHDGIDRSYGITLTCMMLVAFTFACLAIFAPRTVMRIYTDKEELQAIGVTYLRIVGFAWPMSVFSMAMSSLLRSTGKVRIPLWASIGSVVTNISLNWLLIGGHWGAPALGVRGAAIATVCAAAVNMLVCLICAGGIRYPYIFHFRRHFRWTKPHLKEYFKKCFPILCNELLLGIGNAGISIILGRQSEQAIAAIAVFRTIEGLIIGFFAGFSNASSILVGQSVGAGDLETAWERAKRIVYLCSGTIFVVCLAVVCCQKPILTVMGLSGQSYTYGVQLLLIYCVAAILRMGNWTMNDTYRASGDAVFGTVLEIVFMYLMLLPAVYLTGMKLHAPLAVVFLCCYIDEPVRYTLMQFHLYSGKWIKPVTPQGKAALETFRAARKRKKA